MHTDDYDSIRNFKDIRLYTDLMDKERQKWRFRDRSPDVPMLDIADAYRRATPGIREINTLIDLGLARYQAKFTYSTAKPNLILFPNLIDLQDGDTIYNTTKDQVYTVDEAVLDNYDIFTGYAVISIVGDDSIDIDPTDVLTVPEERLIRFLVSFPTGEVHEESNADSSPLKDGKFKTAITYRVLKVEVGALSPFSGTYKQLAPQFIDTVDDTYDPETYYYEVSTQAYDNLVQYIVWATSNILADILVQIFEGFMVEFLPVLLHNGVLMAHHAGRNDDRFATRWRPNVASRNLTMYYRTQTAHIVKMRKTGDIIINPKTREGVE